MGEKGELYLESFYLEPATNTFTVYTKSGCPNCTKVKKLLKNEINKDDEILIVDCDDYLIENKAEFLEFIQKKANKEWKTFPMVFYKSDFIGGFDETLKFKEKLDKLIALEKALENEMDF